MTTHQVHSNGIYHGLPVYSESLRGLKAIVTGANGISGQHMLRVLAQAPERWEKIYCLSRRPPAIPAGVPANAEHIPLDFLSSPTEIGKMLKDKGVQADYIFFFSYIQIEPKEGRGLWSNAQEMCNVNRQLLSNFLEALQIASIRPKRILLQTGAKNYGVHLGPAAVPQEEDDPRITLEPNFYYDQEDCLFDYCQKENVGWNVARPSYILGAVPDAAMNLCFPLAVYAAVNKYLGRPLIYPAGLESWEATQDQSSAMLNAYLEEWAVLEDGAKDQAFNASDGSAFAWGKFWPKLAKLYGIKYIRPEQTDNYLIRELPHNPPPRGFGPPGKIQAKFTMSGWASLPEVKKAWRELAEKHDLVDKEFKDTNRIFSFLDAALLPAQNVHFSVTKARKLGFHGFVDSSECILQVFHEFAKMKMIPPVPSPVPTRL